MEVENPRIRNGEEGDGEIRSNGGGGGDGGDGGGGIGRLCGWPSSRIVRVSRASGGKDRHSKVWTSKGLRDRRVRLSVNTAVQFYDLQDRLGYDQPSKAVEWLLKAAAPFIAELPSLNASFTDTLQLADERKPGGGGGGGGGAERPHSSPSDTSKASGLSRSESRILARDRARGRAIEKSKEINPPLNPNSQNSSFTELLTGGGNNGKDEPNFFSGDFPAQIHLENHLHLPAPMTSPASTPLFSISTGEHLNHNHNHFSFITDHHRHQHSNHNEYNLNFTISPSSNSPGLAGFRGTLQSNSSSSSSSSPLSLLPHLHRFHSMENEAPTSYFTAAAPTSQVDNHHHHFLQGLQLYYGDSQSDQKGKGKN